MQSAIADSWKEISPLDYCPDFKIKFAQTANDSYKLKIPKANENGSLVKEVADINDLSSITDTLLEHSIAICAKDETVLAIERDSIVFKVQENKSYQTECRRPYKYTSPYIALMTDMVEVLQHKGNRCDQLLSYTELQTKIDDLSSKDLIKLDSPGDVFHNLIKLFTDDQTDEMVNLFATCGGQKNSHKFVENLILLESKKACLMPSPPGLMSFEEAKKVASYVGNKYKDMGITDLNGKKDEITHDAILALTESVTKKEIGNLVGPLGVDPNDFVNELDSFKDLKSRKLSSSNIDYITEVFAIDATFEAAEKVIPILGRATFKDKLPVTWSDAKKEAFLNTKLLPGLNKTYNKCITADANRLGFAQGTAEERLKVRKKLKQDYCAANPDQCLKKSCDEKVNLISNSPFISNSQVIQGCVMKAMLENIRPIIKAAIADQRDTFKQFFDLDNQLTEEITEKGWQTLNSCIDEKVGLHLGKEEGISVSRRPEHLQKVSAEAFTKIVTDCSTASESVIAEDLYGLTLRSQPALKQSLKNSKKKIKGGDPVGQAVDEILARSYSPCMRKQQAGGVKANPVLCRPAVEMAAAGKVIEKTISDLFKEAGLAKDPTATLAIKEFENCAEESLKETLNMTGKRALATSSDAEVYLDNNPAFLNCVKNAVVSSSSIIGGTELQKSADSSKDSVKDMDYFLSFKPEVSEMVGQCFKRRLSKIDTWSGFNKFNDNKGLDALKEQCGQEVSEFIMPKVLKREATIQLSDLKGQDLLRTTGQVERVMSKGVQKLKQKYKINQTNQEAIIKEALSSHIANGGSQNSFIEEFGHAIKENAIDSIYQNLRRELGKSNTTRGYTSFFRALTPQCINTLLDQYSDEILVLTKKMEGSSQKKSDDSTLQGVLIDLIVKGLDYQVKLGRESYYNKINQIKDVCRDPKSYKTPMSLARSGAFDFMLKAQIQNSTVASFKEITQGQCIDDLKKLGNASADKLIDSVCSSEAGHQINSGFDELLNLFKDNPEAKREILFIKERHAQMHKTINEKLESPKAIESMLFSSFSLLSYIHENFTDVIANNEDVKKELNIRVVRRLFHDKSSGSFADKFSKTQLNAGVGLGAYEIIKAEISPEAIDDAVEGLDIVIDKHKVRKAAIEGLDYHWKPRKLDELFSWHRMETDEREKLINALFENAIMPSLNDEQMNSEKLNDVIAQNLKHYVYPDSRRSFQSNLKNGLSKYVTERATEMIGIE
ncbi:MAG: hypothetical protein CME64_16930 [Halobacteriovoraceae bacterium]|nr:hypothetical protein [Halobacteriovoraceae bacterium]|tara:strand:- start:210003 stop:213698 length:3696 start_codon:yes stop_codon:yes gene_type:complete